MKEKPKSGYVKTSAECLVIALVYVVTARLGQHLAIPPGNVTPVWLPSGIILAAVLVKGPRVWPGIFLGAFAGNIWAYLDWETYANLKAALFSASCNGIGDALCAVVGAALIRRTTGGGYPFNRGEDVVRFILFGAVLGGGISALFGVSSLCMTGLVEMQACYSVATTWWVGDAVGVMILTPLLLTLPEWTRLRLRSGPSLELGIFLGAGYVLTAICMGTILLPGIQLPLIILVPMLMWPVFRFSPCVTFLATFLLSITAVIETVNGASPFIGQTLNESLVSLQVFLSILTTTIYILSGVVTERKIVNKDLMRTSLALQEARLSLVDAERMQTIGSLAAGVAHEVKNPLAVIRLSMDFLKRKLPEDDPVINKVVGNLYGATDKANSIVMGMLDFAAPRELQQKEVQVEALLEEAKNLTDHAMLRHHVELAYELPETLPAVQADDEKCVQVLVNLFLNACYAICEHGRIRVTASVVPMVETSSESSHRVRDALELQVEDTGPGIPAEVLPRLFEPFFTTKEKDGNGLGLCVSRMIMNMHGGDLIAENSEEGGARFRVYWPLRAES